MQNAVNELTQLLTQLRQIITASRANNGDILDALLNRMEDVLTNISANSDSTEILQSAQQQSGTTCVSHHNIPSKDNSNTLKSTTNLTHSSSNDQQIDSNTEIITPSHSKNNAVVRLSKSPEPPDLPEFVLERRKSTEPLELTEPPEAPKPLDPLKSSKPLPETSNSPEFQKPAEQSLELEPPNMHKPIEALKSSELTRTLEPPKPPKPPRQQLSSTGEDYHIHCTPCLLDNFTPSALIDMYKKFGKEGIAWGSNSFFGIKWMGRLVVLEYQYETQKKIRKFEQSRDSYSHVAVSRYTGTVCVYNDTKAQLELYDETYSKSGKSCQRWRVQKEPLSCVTGLAFSADDHVTIAIYDRKKCHIVLYDEKGNTCWGVTHEDMTSPSDIYPVSDGFLIIGSPSVVMETDTKRWKILRINLKGDKLWQYNIESFKLPKFVCRYKKYMYIATAIGKSNNEERLSVLHTGKGELVALIGKDGPILSKGGISEIIYNFHY